jgi:hypothetical protein
MDPTNLTLYNGLLFKKQERDCGLVWNGGFAERIKHPIYVTNYPIHPDTMSLVSVKPRFFGTDMHALTNLIVRVCTCTTPPCSSFSGPKSTTPLTIWISGSKKIKFFFFSLSTFFQFCERHQIL